MRLVSIVCASYNSALYIEETIRSVISQKYKSWELIVVDDNSTDNTHSLITNFVEKDNRIKLFINKNNKGPGFSRNVGIKNATGDFLTFIDSDDLWDQDFLKKSIDFQLKNNYNFTFSSYYRLDEELKPLYAPFIVPDKVNYEDLLKSGYISCLTAFINIKALGKEYMPEIRKRQDYAFFLNYIKKVDYAYGLKDILATYRIRKNSVSSNKLKAIIYVWKVYKEIEKLSTINSLYYLFFYSINGMIKYEKFKMFKLNSDE